MSRKLTISKLSQEELNKLSDDLVVYQEASKYAFSSAKKEICLYEVNNDDLYVPFSYSNKISRPARSDVCERKFEFIGQLRENQKEVRDEAMKRLNSHGSILISSYTGFGKTLLAIYLATRVGLQTLIICHRVVLMNQWKEAIKKFCPTATVSILGKKDKFDTDFIIANGANIPKYARVNFSKIGCLIVDEAHLIMAENLSKCMRYIVPRYVIGLTATPYRTDGLNVLLDMYFGTYKIVRKLFRQHTVYKVNTGFVPEIKMNKMGKVDWSSVIDSQCNDAKRNELIIRIVKKFSDRTFLILCKRVAQAEFLERRLQEEGENVTSLIGSNQEYEASSRILVGTSGKIGTGFDHPSLNTLLLASDVEQYFIQYLGRVFRREDTHPIIFDLVDNYGLLHKHYRTRSQIYREHGGTIKEYSEDDE